MAIFCLEGICIEENPRILVIRKSARPFIEVLQGLKDDIDGSYPITDYIITEETDFKSFKEKVLATNPKLLIVMDNLAVDYALKLTKEKSPSLAEMSVVAAMALNLEKILQGENNFCGISYEIPAFSMITNFKSFLANDIKNVSVLFRKSEFNSVINTEKVRLKREKISLKPQDMEESGKSSEDVSQAVKKWMTSNQTKVKDSDLHWIMLDNGILNSKNFLSDWIPFVRSNQTPFICGLEKLASKKFDFCVYAASPVHYDLGSQLSQIVFSILEDGLTPKEIKVESIVSIKKTLNLSRAEQINIPVKSKEELLSSVEDLVIVE
jgi:ABC-type uncharacterized transport system substrate-binding protein